MGWTQIATGASQPDPFAEVLFPQHSGGTRDERLSALVEHNRALGILYGRLWQEGCQHLRARSELPHQRFAEIIEAADKEFPLLEPVKGFLTKVQNTVRWHSERTENLGSAKLLKALELSPQGARSQVGLPCPVLLLSGEQEIDKAKSWPPEPFLGGSIAFASNSWCFLPRVPDIPPGVRLHAGLIAINEAVFPEASDSYWNVIEQGIQSYLLQVSFQPRVLGYSLRPAVCRELDADQLFGKLGQGERVRRQVQRFSIAALSPRVRHFTVLSLIGGVAPDGIGPALENLVPTRHPPQLALQAPGFETEELFELKRRTHSAERQRLIQVASGTVTALVEKGYNSSEIAGILIVTKVQWWPTLSTKIATRWSS